MAGSKEKARANLFRNIAYCIHWAMWRREMTEEELVEKSGLPAKLIREVLVGDVGDLRLTELAEICFALDMRPDIRIEAIEPLVHPAPEGGEG